MSLMKDRQGRIMVYIRVTDLSPANVDGIKSAGAVVVHVDHKYSIITAYIDLDRLDDLASLDTVANIREALKPSLHQAACPQATTSEGDAELRAAEARQLFGLDGSGVIVGVMSDSYARVTIPTSADDDIGSGDLPGTGNPCGRLTPVSLLAEYTGADATDEGRAMLQIVHDLAPGASLVYATAFNGFLSFAENIVKLRNEGKADIIVDDVSYSNEPFFQDGPIAVAVEQVTKDGALYFTSAGNSNVLDESGRNVSSYEAAAYRLLPCPTMYNEGKPVDPPQSCHNFDPSGQVPYQEITLKAGGKIDINFQWAEPWFNVTTDLDLALTDQNFNVLASSGDTNTGANGTQTPHEEFSYTNNTGSTQTYRIIIVQETGQGTPRIKYQFEKAEGLVSTLFNASNSSDIFGPSVMGHAGGKQALSIAAVPYNDPNSPEDFTAWGPFTVYFEKVAAKTPAAALSTPEVRSKPDLAAIDGGANTFFGQYDGSAYRFYGTSAAAPHAAAVAALVRQQYLKDGKIFGLTQQKMEKILKHSASEVENGSPASIGEGLIDAVDAVRYMRQLGSPTPFAPLLLNE